MVTLPLQSCDPDDDIDDNSDCDTCVTARKPNIYIYPTSDIQLTVKLDFPLGGKVIKSIPEYGQGWNVSVDTSGLIDTTYTFLFYESVQPDIWQKQMGWCVETNELESFFRKNMTDYGFKGNEIDDYIDYWIPRLDEYAYYAIYPQTKSIIDHAIVLDLSKKPDHLLRLFYIIKGHNQKPNDIPEPSIDVFKREGYFVTEWGVVLN